MRKVDAPRTKRGDDAPPRKRLKKGEKNGQKRMACVGGVYSVAPFRRTVEDVLNEILRKEKQEQRPQPQNKRLRAVLTREVDGKEVNAKDVVFDWLAKELQQRDPHEQRTVVAIMDGETKLRDLQELKIGRAIGILDIWHVTEYLWELAYCFYRDGSDEAEAFVETYLRKLLEGKVNRVIGGIRQMATKRELSEPKWEKVEDCLTYFAARADYMKYDEYLAAGYPIGSGVVEGACRHLVKDRMEQAGMRWRIAGAQAILSLRAIYVNDDWEAFHADRIQTEQRKLYPYKKRLRRYPKLRNLTRSRGCNRIICGSGGKSSGRSPMTAARSTSTCGKSWCRSCSLPTAASRATSAWRRASRACWIRLAAAHKQRRARSGRFRLHASATAGRAAPPTRPTPTATCPSGPSR